MKSAQATPGTPAQTSRAHAVYDTATGSILHVHHTVEFEGGAPVTEPPEARAKRMAGSRDNADVVEVDPADVNYRRPIKIDLATRKLVQA